MQMYTLIPHILYKILNTLFIHIYVIYSYVADPASSSPKAHSYLPLGVTQAGAAGQGQGPS